MPVDSEQPKVDLIHETNPDSPDFGRVKDVGAAHELAILRQKVMDRERELAVDLTPEQRKNLLAIDFLPTKYPQAFVRIDGVCKFYDDQDRPFLVAKPMLDAKGTPLDRGTMVFTQNGVTELRQAIANAILNTDNLSLDSLLRVGKWADEVVCNPKAGFTSYDGERLNNVAVKGNFDTVDIIGKDHYNVIENPGRIKETMVATQEKYKDSNPEISFLDQL